ncbi:MAG: AAA family ATPase [Actinomycetota bacterium]
MAVSSRPRPDGAPPIGRDVEAARLAQMVDDAAAGAKRAALLLGAPGIGKTTLLRYAHARADGRDYISAVVRVPAAAGLPPRYPLGALLEAILRGSERRSPGAPERLRHVVDALTGASSVEGYAVSLPQIADALEETGRTATLAIFIDDYQWAPPEGTELLMAALRIVETPLFFLATARLRGSGEEASTALPEPTADLWIDHIEVRGLDFDAVGRVAAGQLGGDVMPSLAEALSTRTLGNPLYIRETVQGWRAHGALLQTGGYWGLNEEATLLEARSLREMITARFATLDEDIRAVVAALAIIGRPASFDELGVVAGLEPDRLVESLSALDADGLIASEGDGEQRYRLTHPLYASSMIEALGQTRTARMHGRAGDELRRRAEAGHPTLASELAHHAVRALHPPDDLRDLLAAAAAEAEAAGSDEEAAVWYGHMAEHTDNPTELVRALAGQGSAVTRSDPQRAVHLFTYALQLEAAPSARARLLLGRARAHRVAGMVDETLEDLGCALPLADPADRFDVQHAIGTCHGMQGRTDEAEEIFSALSEASAGTPARYKALGHLGMVRYVRGAVREAADLQTEALRHTDDPDYAAYLRSNLTWMSYILGLWDQGDALHEESLREAVAKGHMHDEATLCCAAARVAAWRGDFGRAFDEGRRAMRLATRLGNPSDIINAYDALAVSFLENGMPAEAAAMLPDVLALDEPGIEPREFALAYAVFAEAAWQCGDVGRARTALTRARHHLSWATCWEIAVSRTEASLDLALGDPLAALDRLRPWLNEPSVLVFEQAHVLEVAAVARSLIGDRGGAQEAAQEAHGIYDRLGARRRADRVTVWLDSHRVRRPGRPRSTLPGNLTQRETEILRLVVLGGSNRDVADRLFISIATVKKHLENLMGKAGVPRRQELLQFAISIGALSIEDLNEAAAAPARRVVDLTRLERVRAD